MAEKDKSAVSKSSKPSFFQGVKREWNKIMWLTRDDIIKRTALVIVMALILGAIITVIDSAALYLVDFLISI